jgi:plastocyanin
MRKFLLALALLAAFPMAAIAQDTVPNKVTVLIKDFDFAPMDVTIPAGGSVTWTNRDGEPHTVTSTDGLFRSGALDQDQSFTITFAKPGTYAYLCSIHPKMRATVTVR